ncbi:MAG: DUF1801 domain-containing protein [Aestuariivirgaceae bacterium]
MRPFDDPAVAAVFDAYPSGLRMSLLKLRELIFDTARDTDGVGDLVETTKWGQPAYHPVRPRTGTTIRIDALRDEPDCYAMFFHCQTTLIDTFRDLYADQFVFRGNRAVVFSSGQPIAEHALKHCIALSLTYHMKPRSAGAKPARH